MREVLPIVQFRLIRVLIALMVGLFTPAVLWAQATLENPQPGSFQSGIGLISGWICNATRIDIEVDGSIVVQAAYGTLRGDTTSVCGDANNGFGLLVNWNLLGDGTHTLRALADGVEIARSTFVVTTLGLGDFPRGLSGSFILPNFPQAGKSTRLQWQESLQSFVITNTSGISSGGGSGSAGAALENPQPGSFQSGIGLISGWICNATRIDIEVDGSIVVQAAYGTLRGDTTSVCGDANNGFGLLVNWNLLGDGTHTLRAFADGVEIAHSTFTVATLGLGDFPRGLSGTFELANFPQAGKITHIQWQESLQNFVITNVVQSGNPQLVTSSEALSFGSVTVGNNKELSFTVTNNGGDTLTGNATASLPFSIVSGGSFSLGAGANHTVQVRFQPSSAGSFSGSVEVNSNGGNVSVGLEGTGTSQLYQLNITLTVTTPSEDVFRIKWSVTGDAQSTDPDFHLWLYVGGPDQWQHIVVTDERSGTIMAENGVGDSYCFRMTASPRGEGGPPWPPDAEILGDAFSGNEPPCPGN